MRAGKLLAFDAPSRLKETALDGLAWDVRLADLLAGLELLEGVQGVQRVGLAGDHLRVIADAALGQKTMAATLKQAGLADAHIEAAEPNLEDVFLALAGE
jgi:ABC-2 type transport system ATP-binding protein